MVRGWIKASAWAVAAWCDRSIDHEITLSGSGGIAQAGLTFAIADETTTTVQQRIGPPERQGALQIRDNATNLNLPRDQCIFMSYFKVVDRMFWFTIKAKAGDNNLQPGGDEDNGADPVQVDIEGVEVDEVSTEPYRPRFSPKIEKSPETLSMML